MKLDRRSLVGAGLGLGGLALIADATAAATGPRIESSTATGQRRAHDPQSLLLEPGTHRDQTVALQGAIDVAQRTGQPVHVPPGRFIVQTLRLGSGARLIGAGQGATTLQSTAGGPVLLADRAADITIEHLSIDAGEGPAATHAEEGLIALDRCVGASIRFVSVSRARGHGISVVLSSGRIADCTISGARATGLFCLDGLGVEIVSNHVVDCGNNGIQVWRSTAGEDGTIVTGNRIEKVSALAGGTGENGNGINIYRAGNVIVAGNRVADCAYSAIRANSASNVQITSNNCSRLGEVAIYAEFAFEGALIAGNLVDVAASGIVVTNFNQGGRLAVVSGNLVRNLFRRESEPQDKRGEGIAVEADAAISGNVVEGAPTAGMMIGWGPHMRAVSATGNTIRSSRTGIIVSSDGGAGPCLVTNNLITGATDGAVRAHDRGRIHGPDLALEPARSTRVSIMGNLVV